MEAPAEEGASTRENNKCENKYLIRISVRGGAECFIRAGVISASDFADRVSGSANSDTMPRIREII